MNINDLDPWQKKVLETKGHIVLRAGRQVGKSTVISLKVGDYAATEKNRTILVISAVERQANLLLEKILDYLLTHHKKLICTGSKKPTRHLIQLTNGCKIYCLPTGLSGYGIRGYTVDLLVADEAAFIQEAVWTAVSPMIAASGGTMILLSTPLKKEGYFYNCFKDKSFTSFHVSSEKCKRIPKAFLAGEKKRMTVLQYAQEYKGEFVDDLTQFFTTELINERTTLEHSDIRHVDCKYFLGVDIARYGGDQSSYVVVEKTTRKELNVKEVLFSENMSTMHVIGQIKALHEKWSFTKIYIDDGGLGAPILDYFLSESNYKRVIEGINNAKRAIDYDPEKGEIGKRLMKHELYSNLLSLMHRKQINLIDNSDLIISLTSIQYEYSKSGVLTIFGKYTHITEGLIRACWCVHDKSLNIWIR